MYLTHFALKEAPFSITPDPRFLYMSERHQEALAHLLYGIGEGGGFIQLTGEVGTGKTSICRCLLEQLPPDVDIALVLNPRLSRLELLATVCDELRVTYERGTGSGKGLVDALYRHLLDAHARGRRTVVILDEAQDLAPDVLEEVRLLTNLETSREKLLQIILIGQPELIRLLGQPKLRQVDQRVTARYHLLPLSREETHAYVRHRMAVAGRPDRIFTDGAVRVVYRLSGGIPRLINVIGDRALLGAYTRDRSRVDRATARRAAAEVLGRRAGWSPGRPRRIAAGLLALGAAAALVLLLPGEADRRDSRVERGDGVTASLTDGRSPGTIPPAPAADRPAPAAGRPAPAAGPEATSAVVPARATLPDVGGDGGPTRLADLLKGTSRTTALRDAFGSLLARWDLPQLEAGERSGCDRAHAHGLECLFLTGSWTKLRRIGLPAIIEVAGKGGDKRYLTLVATDGNHATLRLGEREVTLPFREIDPFWEGTFILLWRPPPVPLPVTPGMRGKAPEWLSARLAEVDGDRGPVESPEVYGDALIRRVVAFQRARSLPANGIVGIETAIGLAAAARDPGWPWLQPPSP